MKLFLRLSLYFGILSLIVSGGIWLFLFRLGGVEYAANKFLASAFGSGAELKVQVGKITGSYYEDVTVTDITVSIVRDSTESLLAYVPSLSARFDIRDLAQRRFSFANVTLNQPTIHLHRDSLGRVLFPRGGSAGKSSSTGTNLRIEKLVIDSGRFRLFGNADTVALEELFVAAEILVDEATLSARIDSLSGKIDSLNIGVSGGGNAIAFHKGRLALQDVHLRVNEGEINFDAAANLTDTLSVAANVEVVSGDLAWVNRLFGTKLRGVLDIAGSFTFAKDTLHGLVTTNGTFMGVSFDYLTTRFLLAGERLQFDTLYGNVLDNSYLAGRGGIDFSGQSEQYWLGAEVRNLDIARIIPKALQTDLNGSLELSGSSFDEDLFSIGGTINLFDSEIKEFSVHSVSGSIDVTTRDIFFHHDFRVGYGENEVLMNGTIPFEGEMGLSVDADLREFPLLPVDFMAQYLTGRGTFVGAVSGPVENPTVSGVFTSDSIWIDRLFSSRMQAELLIPEMLSPHRGTVDLMMHDGFAWDLAFDTLATRLHLDSGVLFFDSIFLRGDETELFARGSYRYDRTPGWLLCDSMSITWRDRHFSNEGQLAAEVDTTEIIFRQMRVREEMATIGVSGSAGFDDRVDLALSFDDLGLRRWLELVDTTPEFDGRAAGDLFLSGTLDDPKFLLEMRIDSLSFDYYTLGNLELFARYVDRDLRIDSLSFTTEGGRWNAQGSLPVDLALRGSVVERLPDAPISFEMQGADSALDVVSLFLPEVEDMSGLLSARMGISGTSRSPELAGEASLVGGRIKYFDLRDPILTDRSVVSFENNRILLDSVSGYLIDPSRKAGRKWTWIGGEIRVPALDTLDYDLHVTTEPGFPVRYELADMAGRIQADLFVRGPSPPTRLGAVTTVGGDVAISEMRDRSNFSDPGQGIELLDAFTGDKQWDVNVNILFPGNYWIQNDDIDAEFSGELTFIRQRGRERLLGEMNVSRGRAFLFNRIFRIEAGSQVVFDGSETFNPSLAITASTRIPSPSTSAAEIREELELGLQITGTLENPEFSTVSGSQFSNADIVPLLVANYNPGSTSGGGTAIEGRLSQALSARLSQLGSRSFKQLGVETFELESGAEGELDPLKSRVTLGFYTAPNLYVYGRTSVSGRGGEEVGFEYRLNRSVMFEGRRDELELYHLNLTLHWDF